MSFAIFIGIVAAAAGIALILFCGKTMDRNMEEFELLLNHALRKKPKSDRVDSGDWHKEGF